MAKRDQYAEMICPQCDIKFKPRHSRQFRCSFKCSKLAHKEKQQQKRYKICTQCKGQFFDDTYKNSRHMCPVCEVSGFSEVVDNLKSYAPNTILYSEEKIIQKLSEMRKNEKFYGRVGEVLFLHIYPDSVDINIERGETSPFDFTHRFLGKIDVKTCLPVFSYGAKSWSFQKHKDASCDFLFCFGLEKERKSIGGIWLLPRKIFLSGSMAVCYDKKTVEDEKALLWLAPFEITHLYDLTELNSYLQKLLKVQPKWTYDLSKLKRMSSIWKGRLGELIFYQLHPKAKDMLIARGIDSPYDFEDPVLGKVDVKTGAFDNHRCFSLRRKGKRSLELADTYFYVGLNRAYNEIVALFRIPKEVVHNLKGTLKLKPNDSPYEVTSQYDLSNIDIMNIRNDLFKIGDSSV
jgi:hypothetical protein